MSGSHSTRPSRCSGLAHGKLFCREGRVECPELVEGLSTGQGAAMAMADLPTINPPAVHAGGVFVYIVAGEDGTLYVGSAKDVSRRIRLHRTGRGAKFTHDHGGARLVY